MRGIGQIAGHLIDPWTLWFRDDSSDVDFPGDSLDDEQDVVRTRPIRSGPTTALGRTPRTRA